MNSLANLSRKNLKVNKSKNILIIIAIILSTALITTIGILSYSIQQMNLRQVIEQTGVGHVSYRNITNKQLEILKNNKKVDVVQEYLYLGENYNYPPYSLELCYSNEEAGNYISCFKLKKGKWPKHENDIAMPKWVLEKIGVKPEIGQKVNLSYINDRNKQSKEGKGEFVVSGILDDGELGKNEYYNGIAIVSKDYILKNLSNDNIFRQAYVLIKGFNVSKTAYEVGHNIGINDKNIKLNKQYIAASGLDMEFMLPGIIAAAVVIFATILVIYNIFYISISERIKLFGLLAALGATKKQIRKVIFKEGLILSLIGIPVGILLGHILSFSIIPLIHLNGKLKIEFSPYIVVISIIVSLITVIISLRKPSKIASKIAPIEAVKYTGVKINSNKKERKSNGKVKLSKLAYLNLWRNKKRTIITIISMSLTGILFMTFSVLFSNIQSSQDDHIRGDFELTSSHLRKDDGSDPLNINLINNIKNLKGINKVDELKYLTVWMEDKNIINKYKSKYKDLELGNAINCDFFGYTDSMLNELNKYVIKGKIIPKDIKDNKVIIVSSSRARELGINYNIGDKIQLTFKSGNNVLKKEFTVAAIVRQNTRWLGYSNIGPEIITHETVLSRNFKDTRIGRLYINVDSNNYDAVNTKLKKLTKGNDKISYFEAKEYNQKQESELRDMKIVSITALFIIGLIGILNSINTMATSIFSRKKELGIMQAVGLSNYQLRKLLQIEGIYYAIISIVISVIGGNLFSYVYYLNQKSNFNSTIQYNFLIKESLMITIIFLLVQIGITYVAEKKLKQDYIVDRIRFNE
ncbi:macrolide export ATP-binding/permease protein MacB [Clostridium acetireducens DSM 10703]|uniref:Macrolide export ATP-binding/permease protein MacB n=1 Tax=Clostridium acetireducens DSM 10703 TaxID=1121290 RepID=A0A1E8EVV7_9CLOT|nr:FtsX-like permease family protein [Clostridium acetireducens]OFI01384.1 macrolide export ATP-binding/permease protein MacB [Clostridium acetireducens DSM 10703]